MYAPKFPGEDRTTSTLINILQTQASFPIQPAPCSMHVEPDME